MRPRWWPANTNPLTQASSLLLQFWLAGISFGWCAGTLSEIWRMAVLIFSGAECDVNL